MQNLKEMNKDKNVEYLLNLLGFEENEIIDSIKELKYELNEEVNRDEKRCFKKINIITEINDIKIQTEYTYNDSSNIYTKNIVLYQNDKLLKNDKDYYITPLEFSNEH
jgi:hypothetical protein